MKRLRKISSLDEKRKGLADPKISLLPPGSPVRVILTQSMIDPVVSYDKGSPGKFSQQRSELGDIEDTIDFLEGII